MILAAIGLGSHGARIDEDGAARYITPHSPPA